MEQIKQYESGKEQHDELADNKAEANFKKESDLYAFRDTLLAKFDTGVSMISDDAGFKRAFKDALDTLIQNEVARLVNVSDLKELTPEKRNSITAAIKAWMLTFNGFLDAQIGYRRDVSDVEAAKKLLPNSFKNIESVEVIKPAVFTFELKKDGAGPKSLAIDYARNPNEKGVKMIIKTNAEYYKSQDKTTEGTLADKISKNGDIYNLENVNYKIENPKAFQEFILKELGAGKYDIRAMTEEEAVEAAANIVKSHLRDAKNSGPMESDKTPMDKLLMTGMKGCCRHFAAATKVVFEQIQQLAQKNNNYQLRDTVAFENKNPAIAHATIAIARGNDVTTIDPYWSQQGANTGPDGKGLDATFDGKHGNVTSLYSTLSTKDKIFDPMHAEQLLSEVRAKNTPEDMSKIDNAYQDVLFRADQMQLRESLQTPQKLGEMAQQLNILTTFVLRKNLGVPTRNISAVDMLILNGVLKVSKRIKEIISNKISTAGNQNDKDYLIYAGKVLSAFTIAPLQKRLAVKYSDLDTKKEHPNYTYDPDLQDDDESLFRFTESELKKPDLSDAYKNKLKIALAERLFDGVHFSIFKAIKSGLNISENGRDAYEKNVLDPAQAKLAGYFALIARYGISTNESISQLLQSSAEYIEKNIDTATFRNLANHGAKAIHGIFRAHLY